MELLESKELYKQTLDKTWLIPRKISTIKSRSQTIDTSVKIGDITLDIPIISSPMKDVVDLNSAYKIVTRGGMAILHRFNTIDEQTADYTALCDSLSENNQEKYRANIACAVGIDKNSCPRIDKLYKAGCRTFCVDVANGANTYVGEFIKAVVKKFTNIKIIAGNVGSIEGFNYLAGLSDYIVGIRVGIAGGCFIKGTQINTDQGLKNIENIKPGDTVLTHNGTYQKVLCTSQRQENKQILDINGINCTDNHEFYALHKKYENLVDDNNIHEYCEWVSAVDLSDDYFLISTT